MSEPLTPEHVCPKCADAAALRLAFNRAAAQQDLWQHKPMAVWEQLYAAIQCTQAGLAVLQEIACLRARLATLDAAGQRLADALETALEDGVPLDAKDTIAAWRQARGGAGEGKG